MPFIYRLIEGTLSIARLHRALQQVVHKHCSLRTSIRFDSTTNCLIQRIIEPTGDNKELFAFIRSSFNNDDDLRTIILDELRNPLNFDLSDGRVFRVHVVLHQTEDQDILRVGDYLIFNFHRIVFDLPSWDIFYRDLRLAYECETTLPFDTKAVRYIDCK